VTGTSDMCTFVHVWVIVCSKPMMSLVFLAHCY